MIKKIIVAVLAMVASAQTGLCDWHHQHGHGTSGAPDPALDAFMTTAILIVAASIALLFLAGPVLIIRTRRIRDIFWVVPLANTALYILSISLGSYPGGFVARFQPPGLANTVLEVVLMVLSSLFVALVLAIIQWLVRTVGKRTKKQDTNVEQTAARDGVPSSRAP